MARFSVVVPIYDVECYLPACLQSIARQEVDDLEVVMVDDGSTDRSAEVAETFSRHDPRFRLIRQANGGLGHARNSGSEAATGEYLAFVDGDDVVAPGAYDRLRRSLERTGSDLASGNVMRLNRQGIVPAQFLARTFARTRLRTHVTRFRPLLSDRTAWNKLWRRSFWDQQQLRFPEGVVHEDIPVTLPAHLAAASVDVLAAPVYHWRVREDGAPSITQRRLEHAVLRDRLAAIRHVRDYFAEEAPVELRHWYVASIVADDLRLHLDLLDEADDEYRAMFLEGANALLDGSSRSIFRPLPAIDRLKWHFVRGGQLPELLDVLRYQKESGGRRALRERGRIYGDYPHRRDHGAGVPRSAYRLGRRDEDLALSAHLEALRADGALLRLRGRAWIGGLGAATPAQQRTTIAALRPGRWRAVRMRLAPLRLPTAPARDRNVEEAAGVSWAGFEALLDTAALQSRGRWVDGTWELYASTRSGSVRRRRARFVLDSPALIGAVDVDVGDDADVRASVTLDGAVRVIVRTQWARLVGQQRVPESDQFELWGQASLPWDATFELLLERASDGLRLSAPVRFEDSGARRPFRARASLCQLISASPSLESLAAGTPGACERWGLSLAGSGRRFALALPEDCDGSVWLAQGHELRWSRARSGDATLMARRVVRPVTPAPAPTAAPVPAATSRARAR